MRLILLGPPGSGKGTQAKLLCQRLNLAHVSTGDILREAKRLGTPTGRQAAPFMDAGKLVPDDVVNAVIAERFRRDDRPEQFVMDGYPRTLDQAGAFDQVLRQQALDLNAVVVLNVDDEAIVERLIWRRTCPTCGETFHTKTKPPKVEGFCDIDDAVLVQREDDKEEIIRRRLQVYHQQTVELIPYYREHGLLREVNGQGDIEAIYEAMVKALK